jgi:hypothetical protein
MSITHNTKTYVVGLNKPTFIAGDDQEKISLSKDEVQKVVKRKKKILNKTQSSDTPKFYSYTKQK